MADKDGYRRYLDAAAALGQVTRARAEELVRDMMGGAEVPRGQAQQWVDEIVERGKKATEDLVDLVRTEVSSQLEALGLDADDLARQAADILRRSAEAGRRVVVDAQRAKSRAPGPPPAKAAPTMPTSGTKPAGTKKAATASKPATKKAATASKAATKKVPAKKAPAAKNATAKNATAKKASTPRASAPRSPRTSRS